MKKSILLLFVLTIFFVPSMAYAGEKPSQSDCNLEDNAVYKALENIKDETRKSKISELMLTPICYTYSFEGEEDYDFQQPQIDRVDLINNLADLSDNEFEAEVKKLIDELVIQNQDNNNIIWSEEFKDIVVEEYCPQYQNQLNTELLVEPTNKIDMDSVFTKAASTSGSDEKTAVVTGEALGNELYKLKCTVKWSWANNKLTSVTRTPSYEIKSSRYSWGGYSYLPDIEKDDNTAEIVVKGHFIENWAPGIVFKHHYATLSIAVDKNGRFSYVSNKE